MKPSQRQPRQVVPNSHLTRASSAFADSSPTLFNPNHDATTKYDSDLSVLINASHVSHAIASSYHALTIQTLRQHNNCYASHYQSSVDLDTTRGHHASQVSASLEELYVKLPPHLHSNATHYVSTTPMGYFQAYPSSQYQQLGNYQPLGDLQLSYTERPATPHGSHKREYSAKAEFGAEEQSRGGWTYWVPDRERYIHARRNDRDITEWGEDLSGVGTLFDVPSHSEEASPDTIVCEEG